MSGGQWRKVGFLASYPGCRRLWKNMRSVGGRAGRTSSEDVSAVRFEEQGVWAIANAMTCVPGGLLGHGRAVGGMAQH